MAQWFDGKETKPPHGEPIWMYEGWTQDAGIYTFDGEWFTDSMGTCYGKELRFWTHCVKPKPPALRNGELPNVEQEACEVR